MRTLIGTLGFSLVVGCASVADTRNNPARDCLSSPAAMGRERAVQIGMMAGVPQAWVSELDDYVALVEDPDGRAAVHSEMAYAAHRRQEVDEGGLVDMLEMVDAARLWALDGSERDLE